MNLRKKLLAGFGIVLLVTLIAFTLMYLALQNIGASYKGLVNKEVKKLNLAHEIQYEDLAIFDSIKGIILEPSNMKEKEKYNQNVENIIKNIEEVKPLLKDKRAKEVFEELDQYQQELVELETEIINHARDDRGKTMRLFYGDYADVRAIFSENLEEFKQIQLKALSSQVKKDNKFIESQSIISIILVVIALLIGVITALFMSNMITKPLKVVADKLDELSKNEGDLTVRLEVKSKDEIGMLSKSFNQMIENIQNLIRQVQVTTVEVASSAEQLSASADQSAQATNQITLSIQEIASGAETQVKSAEQSTNAMVEMVLGIQKTADSAAHVTEAAQQTTKEADLGNSAIVKSIQQMTTIQEVVGDAGTKVEELGTLSNEIGQILDVISGIADQTNLLALNAAIEAARAGESGRGFAVVADEVRKLAEQSKDSATQITNLIHQIQLNTSHAVQSMKKGTGEVEEGMKVVNEAGNAFNKILLSVQDVSDQILEVSSSSQQMSAGSQQVAAAVQEQSSIAKEASATSHNVATASEEQAATIEEISYSIDNLSKMAEQLQLLVGKFKV